MNPYDLSETPGGYYGIAYWFACMLFIAVNKKRINGIRLYAVQGAALVLLAGI